MKRPRKPRTVWVIALNYRAIWAYYDKKDALKEKSAWRTAELIECVEVIRKKKQKVSP